ncbi:MAG: hypothetical protein A2504_11210 [Bdellovibrionales bacterium RIFOXYD12_FULL_39_22]|nr:MAG: hypothetical protein A2385_09775 [Bdellovibrionales bacterium RIFOXYB1_FULL_39_21]OFZ44241.1 MAG: hypothetical protein A2485_07395 [Bdellovibrionales bacterium RIFOXYC12_FULL_39_17]OFZ46783.1 MAG: hypothetical protein A2404_04630 [Bdellovibrionales bacterium RIFOXYC1_FULL_39_130]OFZ70380.1 MAG: hypothetical protein A2451_03200 [Bdellovibrionales bacterium RIFOXYC2_FULL_39_8]OFZ75940.1 MAG: hypothetical protein A2560_02520 [Bdellovibrionales bacterium RIFOXYD1_FULL_39_84]OFZ95462.1 MAG:
MCNTTDINREMGKHEIALNYCSNKHAVQKGANPAPKLILDGEVVEFVAGDTILQVAERAGRGHLIPRYCYHPGLPIAGTCRMCTVEVEKMVKLMTACSTPAADGMVVHTKTERVLKSRAGVMEFLLINHPLDCPVCDKAGECDLQDNNYRYGPVTSSFLEDKRTYPKAATKKLSEKITLNMNRCVHCERCVRFSEEVVKSCDLMMVNRSWHKELTLADDKLGLTSEYQGCLSDFCPVGALTFNDFRFVKRSWFLQRHPSVCDGCSKGCNIEVHSEDNIIYRFTPAYNEKINGHWICDTGRLSYHQVMDPTRIVRPMLAHNGALQATSWELAQAATGHLLETAKKVKVVIGTDATIEEIRYLQAALPDMFGSKFTFRSFNGTGTLSTSSQDKKLDHLLIMQDKTANLRGAEECKLAPLENGQINDSDLVLLVRFGRSAVPAVGNGQKLILLGVWNSAEQASLGAAVEVMLPGLATVEKSGTYINCDGIRQQFIPAVVHLGEGMAVNRLLRFTKK